jgi:hypothetical protein
MCVFSAGAADAQGKTDSAAYVGSQVCAQCHAGIFKTYLRTSMGRSMVPVNPALLQSMRIPATYDDPKLKRHFAVYAQDGNLFQSEFETDSAGEDVFRDTHMLQWKIGAGENGFGFLTERDGYLFQAPLSYYAHPNAWGPSPGYEYADYGFSRPILTGCIFCHSGTPRPVASTNGQYEPTPFGEVAIGCERCHGPGAEHVQAMQSGRRGGQTDLAIVNPAHRTPELANNLCMKCHQTGDVRVLQPGKSYQDFRPGTPLIGTLAILKVLPTPNAPPDDDHVEHYYSMTLSRCYRASNGRMACISCHDPHLEPSAQEAPTYFNKKCMQCHTSQGCKQTIAVRLQTTPADNCIGCHMPKRDIRVISHASATNHRIVREPGEAFPESAFQQSGGSPQGLVLLDPMPGAGNAPLPSLTLLQAYGELAETKPEFANRYLEILNQLARSQPENALVQAALGRRDLKKGDISQAADHLRDSLRLDPVQPAVAGDLADALKQLGQQEEAGALLKTAIQQDPFNPLLQKKLIVINIGLHRYAEAKSALERYLQVFPQDSFMRQMMDRASAGNAAP